MNKAKLVSTLAAIFISIPIWFFLLHRILTAINASELSWFLNWIYLPTTIFATILGRAVED